MSLPSEPLVSVVTPVYNTEQYLAPCIESVLAQSYENWEYLIVNNCSTDRTLEVAEDYASKDNRIRIVNNDTFLTQVQNYNHALQQISPDSRYCKLVQADDWIFPRCLTEMVAVAEASPSVSIVTSYYLEETVIRNVGLPYPSTFVPGKDVCRLYLLGGLYLFGSPTQLLYRRDLIRSRKPFYDETTRDIEDAELCFDVLQHSDLGFVHQVLTFTRRENESLYDSIRAFNPTLLAQLLLLKKYGPIFLDEKEYAQRLEQVRRDYFLYLGGALIRRRGREFWDYHEYGMRTAAEEFNGATRVKYVTLVLLDLLLSPKNVFKKLRSQFQRR